MKEMDPSFEEEFDLDPEENIRLENQIKKLTLELSGAKFMTSQLEGQDLPPEVESKMLDYILEFDKIQKTAKMISIGTLLKNPKFKNELDLSEVELKKELEKVQKKLFKHGIAIMSVKPVEDRIMYNFLTGEFLSIEVHETHLNGIIRQFIYEEFCPNIELDIERAIFKFNQDVFNINTRDESLLKNYPTELIQKVELFEMLYEDITIENFDIIKYDIKKTKATIAYYLDMKVKQNDSLKTHEFEGEGFFTLKKKKGEWMVIDYILPTKKQN